MKSVDKMETISSLVPFSISRRKSPPQKKPKKKPKKQKKHEAQLIVAYMMAQFSRETVYLCVFTVSQEHFDSETHP